MTTLSIDIETYSSVDLTKTGVYRYVESPDFQILLVAFSFYEVGQETIQIVDLARGEQLPDGFLLALLSPTIRKTAWNANFERTCFAQYFGIDMPANQWQCTMVKTAMLGLPLSLDAAARVLDVAEKKDAAGKALIKYFTVPCKPTKANNHRTRNFPEHAPEKWEAFKSYCVQDVAVEIAINDKLGTFSMPQTERYLWFLDQQINDRGVLLDYELVENAIYLSERYTRKLTTEAIELTGLDNPNSAAQLKDWLSSELTQEVTSLTKEAVPMLQEITDDKSVNRMLEIRQEMAKTSVKKYEAMRSAVCHDGRVRGLLQFYGANRTGRWAGRLVQVQNLPRIEMTPGDLDLARGIVKSGDLEVLELIFGNVPDTLSQLIRTAFVAKEGHRFIIADFSAIEARVIAWLATEKWRLDVFNTHGKIYEASASQMFKVPLEAVTKGSDLRQKGKVSELALGYQGGPNALISMGALRMGILEEELPRLVKMWRNANKKIVQLWYDTDAAAKQALTEGYGFLHHGIKFSFNRGSLLITLPGGRQLSYIRARLGENRFGDESIIYEGMNQTTKQWGKQETYGGKLVENIVQAIARDVLADAMMRLDKKGYLIGMSVHDEVVLEMPHGVGSIEEVNKIMGQSIPWAKGLPLRADSYESSYYKKD